MTAVSDFASHGFMQSDAVPVERLKMPLVDSCHVAEIGDGLNAYALDPDHAKALWAKSEEMVGERF